jgi:YVTN family beta-propeller protein
MQVGRGSLKLLAGAALSAILCAAAVTPAAAQDAKLRILQTNSAGDNINIIDPKTNKVVGEISGIEANHGVASSPDGTRLYFSVESMERVLNVVDGKTLQVIKKIPLSGVANLIDITPDGRWLYVAIANDWSDTSAFPQIKAQPSGGVDVIDTVSMQNVKSIALKGGVHDLNVTPDGKYVIAGSSRGAKPPANMMDVIDTKTNEIAWSLLMKPAPSPMAISTNPDGSTKWVFAQVGDMNGFQVIDFASQKQINEIKLPELPAAEQNKSGPPAVSHGIMVTPDQKTLLVNSRLNSAVYAYSLPDLKLLGGVKLGGRGAGWLTVSPDSKTAYVANEHTNNVSVVDIASLKEVALIPVGFAPARNATWMAP